MDLILNYARWKSGYYHIFVHKTSTPLKAPFTQKYVLRQHASQITQLKPEEEAIGDRKRQGRTAEW